MLIKDFRGENPLFIAARSGDAEIFNWYSGHLDFFKARGEQNYKGQTIEHVVCIAQNIELVDVIKPRPDTKDYYGNLPLFYSIMKNDATMISKYFKKGREYLGLRNYKYETMFHVAAKYNSLATL
jgi:ankyrin repeat protein